MTLAGTVQNGVVILDNSPHLPDGTRVEVLVLKPAQKPQQPRTSLADWAEENAEHWGNQMSSQDVEGFTGRRF